MTRYRNLETEMRRILGEDREDRESLENLSLAAADVGEGAEDIEGAPNMEGVADMEGEQIILGFGDLRIADAGVEGGADEAWTMIPEAAPMRAGANNADIENAGMEREGIDAGTEMPSTSLIVRRERERGRAERDMDRQREIAARLIEAGAENHEVEDARNVITRMVRGGMEAGAVVELMRRSIENARWDEMVAAAITPLRPSREEIEMESQLFNAGVERVAQKERSRIPGLERSRRAFNAVTAMLRRKIVEQRGLRERARRIRKGRERLGFPDENGGHWERVEREAMVRQEEFNNEGMAMVRERERFLREMEFLLGQERLLQNGRDMILNIRERQRLRREMENSLRTRENLVDGSSLLYTELLDALSEERLQLERICYSRCNRLNNVRRSTSEDSA